MMLLLMVMVAMRMMMFAKRNGIVVGVQSLGGPIHREDDNM